MPIALSAHPARPMARSLGCHPNTFLFLVPRPLSFALRLAIVWLLAGLLPLQTLAVVAIAVAGPSHVHRSLKASPLVLDDFRRASMQSARIDAHAAGAWGHVHANAAAERHPHRPGDETVMADVSEARQAADVGDSGSGASLGAFLGMVSASPAWTGGRVARGPQRQRAGARRPKTPTCPNARRPGPPDDRGRQRRASARHAVPLEPSPVGDPSAF